VEGRGRRDTEVLEGKMTGTLRSEDIYTRLQHVAEVAREHADWVLTALAHHIDEKFLLEAYRRTRKDGAPGVDGQTAQEYETNLEENLRGLLQRFKTGSYRAPPVRRVYIPKGDGRMRPIGIPTLEDKVLQRAVTMVLEAVYEQDFFDCSYGFRPGRSAHQALETLWKGLMDLRGGWVLELDIKSFFDKLSHPQLRSFLDQRVRDGVIRRVIGKWLKAGVMEAGEWHRVETGSPQGGVISPLLANVYLHEVLDRWFVEVVKPRMKGRVFLVRYADDAVLVFELESDARRIAAVLAQRFGKYGLELHPEKTRLVDFRSPWRGGKGDGTFDLLGFTHYWGRSRKGRPTVVRKTSKDRLGKALKRVAEWCWNNMHRSVKEQHADLCRKVKGHYAYYGITGNFRSLLQFVAAVERHWQRSLNRRSNKKSMPWERFKKLLQRMPLPWPRVVHSMVT
jgi:RNA-directed DNA polymerase